MSDYLDPNNEELLQDFFAEADSQVELLEANILVLENDPRNRDAIDEVFRAAHTLKGAAATVQMTELAEFTHIVEDAFDRVRESKVDVNGDLIDLLLSAVDIVKSMLVARADGSTYDGDQSVVAAGLAEFAGKPAATSRRAQVPPGPIAPAPPSPPALDADGDAAVAVCVGFDESNPMNSVGGIQVFAALKRIGTIVRTDPDFDALYEDRYHPVVRYFLSTDADESAIIAAARIPDVTTDIRVEPAGPIDGDARPARSEAPTNGESRVDADPPTEAEPAADQPETPDKGPERRRSTPTGSVLRVDSRRVDDLLNLVSEAVINKAAFNQVSGEFTDELALLNAGTDQYRILMRQLFDSLPEYFERMQRGASSKDVKKELNERFSGLYTHFDDFAGRFRQSLNKFRSNTQNLGRITSELQEGVMRIRMVPISQIFSRFPRLVRDLTRTLSKQIDLVIQGEDTELDKSVIEDLLDPLIHCVRNSIDHGLEAPADRLEAGKSETGTLTLRASSEGNMIIIEVADDGRGIDVKAVRDKAIERGVIHASKTLSDVEAFNLIFDPGFSTAKKVSNISGRGVGLDVVRKQIEKLNGSVTVWSAPDEGTRFTIKIPLTLAIIQGLMIRVGTETYAIPITSVVESQRIRPSDIRTLDNYEVLDVREDVVSLLRLSRIFGIATDPDPTHYFVVIVGSGDKKVGLVVDSLIGEEDVVIKPLRDHFTNAPGIAGANITGDGRVSLIIDVAQLLELGLTSERNARSTTGAVIGR
ncbi:MAG: chemotaxis protein CheA [Spirochaetaceae bacterium]|nr:MAG: chemotaxis protein CheA [Spirochaetaceae bacterium]